VSPVSDSRSSFVADHDQCRHLRNDLVTVLDNFVEHASHLEDFDQGWRVFMRQYLSSVQHIVGQQAIIRASRIADTAAVPTSFIEELETLRSKVDELSEERTTLRTELNEQIAEVNILRALPVERNIEPGETVSSLPLSFTFCDTQVPLFSQSPKSPSLKAGDKEVSFPGFSSQVVMILTLRYFLQNFSGVISRLVQKEKEVIELQNKLANIEHSLRDDSDAKKDRSNQNKRWENLLQEIGTYKVKVRRAPCRVAQTHTDIARADCYFRKRDRFPRQRDQIPQTYSRICVFSLSVYRRQRSEWSSSNPSFELHQRHRGGIRFDRSSYHRSYRSTRR